MFHTDHNQNINAILFFLAGLSYNFQKAGNNMDEFELKQGSVAMVEGVRIGCMSTFRGKFLVADGSEKNGVAAILYIEEEDK